MCSDVTVTGKLESAEAVHPLNRTKNKFYYLRLPKPVDIGQSADKQCSSVAQIIEIQVIGGDAFSRRLGQTLTLAGRLLPAGNTYDVRPAILAGATELKSN